MYVYFRIKEFCSILCIFGKTWLYIVLHDFNLTYYSSIILGSFSILLFPKLCWHIGLTPSSDQSLLLFKFKIFVLNTGLFTFYTHFVYISIACISIHGYGRSRFIPNVHLYERT